MDVHATLHFDSAREWRAWLAQNHTMQTAAWLVIHKKHSRQPGLRYDEALEEALSFGWIDGKMQSVDADTYVLRFSPRKPGSVWSQANRSKAERLISEGRMTAAGLEKVNEARDNGLWEKAYTNRVRDEIPPDLLEALEAEPAARHNFENFANSYRNMYIGWVKAARTAETRHKRIIETVERSILKRKPGQDFP